jgi:hypothetical protein
VRPGKRKELGHWQFGKLSYRLEMFSEEFSLGSLKRDRGIVGMKHSGGSPIASSSPSTDLSQHY